MKAKAIIQCLHCRAILSIPRSALGQTVGCPACKGPVPTRAPAELGEEFEVVGDDDAEDEDPPMVLEWVGGEDAPDDDSARNRRVGSDQEDGAKKQRKKKKPGAAKPTSGRRGLIIGAAVGGLVVVGLTVWAAKTFLTKPSAQTASFTNPGEPDNQQRLKGTVPPAKQAEAPKKEAPPPPKKSRDNEERYKEE